MCHDGDGMVSQLVRVSGYKQVDHYAKQLNFPPQKIHPSALIIVDPREPETSRGRVWCAPTVEIGVKLLNAILTTTRQVMLKDNPIVQSIKNELLAKAVDKDAALTDAAAWIGELWEQVRLLEKQVSAGYQYKDVTGLRWRPTAVPEPVDNADAWISTGRE